MGVSHSTARWLAPLSFAVDFAAQQYGMLSTPNMKDVHDANLSFFSPQPYFIAAFFFPQQIFQLAWLWRLYRYRPATNISDGTEAEPEDEDVKTMVDYTPFYTLGNFCIAAWMIFWNKGDLKSANIFVVVNTLAQLYYIFLRRPGLGRMKTDSLDSVLTHVVAKTFAGIGVLDLLHNGSVAYFDHQVGPAFPSTSARVLTGVGFGALGFCSDWIFGGCLAYDLVAIAVGQSMYGSEGWARLLGVYAAGTAGIVGLRNFVRPPYVRNSGYQPVQPSL